MSEENVIHIDKEQLFNYTNDLTIKLPSNREFEPHSFFSILGGEEFIKKFQVENIVVDLNKHRLMMNIKTVSNINRIEISYNNIDTYNFEFFEEGTVVNTLNDIEFWDLEQTFNNYINNLDNDN